MSGKRAKAQRRAQWGDVRALMVAFLREVRALYKRKAPSVFAKYPGHGHPCSTCAVVPKTDSWPGFERTAWHFMQAIQNDAPFYCHDGHPIVDGEYTCGAPGERTLCAAYSVVTGDEAKLTLLAAVRSLPDETKVRMRARLRVSA